MLRLWSGNVHLNYELLARVPSFHAVIIVTYRI